jgi:hypothetical protein
MNNLGLKNLLYTRIFRKITTDNRFAIINRISIGISKACSALSSHCYHNLTRIADNMSHRAPTKPTDAKIN